ncbi:hypothetical protein [Lysinibacillus piscis]|uniref:ParB/Sulfiredoxin domain-containing protein n=1 Tax=Lysinibacillus piscis TaxID=2518931 RepID=A0ABQ5NN70_9BACI|nr:hypothetical protein [Lysinibacillus sp. KH24]GLC89803.1 hypothetical protein LYSBPC_29300 [Lysinibacillus sp. KH24]
MNLDEKLKIFEIDPLLKSKIASMAYKAIYLTDDEFDESKNELKTMNLNDLEGICRPDADRAGNWLEALDILVYKGINFDRYKGREQFKKFLLDPEQWGQWYPVVTYIDDKYYIEGEGKHRLTIAKCLGIKEALVIVKYPK